MGAAGELYRRRFQSGGAAEYCGDVEDRHDMFS